MPIFSRTRRITARTLQGSAPQPLPTTSSRTSAAHHMRLVLLKMGIMMPETCWDIVKNKHLLHLVGFLYHFIILCIHIGIFSPLKIWETSLMNITKCSISVFPKLKRSTAENGVQKCWLATSRSLLGRHQAAKIKGKRRRSEYVMNIFLVRIPYIQRHCLLFDNVYWT